MREIVDKNRLDRFFGEQQVHFRQRPPVLKLVEFEKGEILNNPLQLLSCFYIIVRGSVSIYHLTEDGSIRYISKAASGTLLGDMEFSGAGNQSLYIEAAEIVLCLAIPFRENQRILENDPVFLRFILGQLAGKLSLSAVMTASAQTLEYGVPFRKLFISYLPMLFLRKLCCLEAGQFAQIPLKYAALQRLFKCRISKVLAGTPCDRGLSGAISKCY